MHSHFHFRGAVSLVALLVASTAFGICAGDADISAEPMTDPGTVGWRYTLTIEWSYGDYGMKTWGIFLAGPDSECDCSTLATEISFPEIAGSSTSTSDGCTVPYRGNLACGPDSPIPGWIMLDFHPDPDAVCSMPDGGVTELTFYSILPPQPVGADAQIVLDNACNIHVTGVLPAIACDPVSTEEMPWGTMKASFR